MSSKFIEHSPEAEGDKSLILIMDEDGNVTTDPTHFEKLMNTNQLSEVGIKIVRLNSSQGENDKEGENDEKPELKLTVEEIYPDSLSLASNDTSNNLMSSSLEMLPGTSNEHINHDIVDPFSQMDPEQLQRLKHALASEQAKQILGENVAAMLDMLSVDESPAAFLQNSIKNDHCYTNLLPSSDPNGPSFFVGDVRSNISDPTKGKGKTKLGTPVKGRKVVASHAISSTSSPTKRQIAKDVPQHSKQQQQQQQQQAKESVMDFGLPKIKPSVDNDDPNYEEEVDIEDMDSEASAGVEEDNLSDEDYNDRNKKGKRKPRRNKKIILKKGTVGRPPGRPPVGKPSGRINKRSRMFQEMRVRNEKLNDEMAKVVQSLDYGSKSDDDKSDSAKGPRKGMKKKRMKEEGLSEDHQQKVASESLTGESSSGLKSQAAKYPKRENRKPPAHLAEAFGPALFSTPDIIRRISTGEELAQTPPEKKNFTVGVQKNSIPQSPQAPQAPQADGKMPGKAVDANKANKLKKTESVLKEAVNHVKPHVKGIAGDGLKTASTVLKTAKGEAMPKAKVTVESIEDKTRLTIPVTSERAVVIKKSNPEIQKLIEKHQSSPIKSTVYEEDQDYSDENIEENYYLDPTQMDQSLFESFGQQNCRSEDQLLQEAILLQEQLIGSNKTSELENMSTSKSQGMINFDDTFSNVIEDISDGFVPETIDNIQNEIASVMMMGSQAQQGGVRKSEPGTAKSTKKEDGTSSKRGVAARDSTEKRLSKLNEGQSEVDEPTRESPLTEGTLVVDESRPEERKRNSAKRRRSDEVSDLDSDLDDALSEASWNSEDDPDRLWCICRKPHNNRFMICCDVCEEWFHGKCVGITKTIGKQMEQDGLEWSCPNCTKKKKLDDNVKEAEKTKLLKEKMAQSIREQQLKIRESQKLKNQNSSGKERAMKAGKSEELKQTKISEYSQRQSSEDESVGRKCIMCKGPVRENSIYCSDDCIRKHSQHAISQLMSDTNKKSKSESSGPANQSDNVKLMQNMKKEDSRIIVMDPSSKKVLVGQQAPTAANLATWLKENPSYHVVYKKSDKTGKVIVSSPKVVKIQSKNSGEASQKLIQLPSGQKVSVQQSEMMKSTQLKLAVSPNSKQVKILQTPINQGKKQIYQIVNNSSGGTGVKPTAIIVRQKQPEIIDPLPLTVKVASSSKVVKAKSQEATSPKQTPSPKEAGVVQKVEKMQKKRKERAQKGAVPAVPPKEIKQTLITKTEEGKEKEKEKKDTDQQIRDSVKKTLAETLKARVQECKDMEFNDEHIDGLAVAIEEKLFKHFENKTDSKYKSKYRSLVFNIKDPKNETLFRKILDNSISPKELVKLSPEELASQELARWREKENQHQLEIIKKTELELMTIGNTYIMKSHKGEQVIESDQSEKVAAAAAEIDPNTPAQELVSALNSVSSTTQDANEEEEKKNKGNSEPALMKMKSKEKDHRNGKEKERKHAKRDKDRRRSRSRSRSRSSRHRSKEKKRSRSRDRDRSRHRHKEKKVEKKREGKDEEGSGSPEPKPETKAEKEEITTSEDLEEKTTSTTAPTTTTTTAPTTTTTTAAVASATATATKKPVADVFDDADHEPSSTVNIKTPDINVEESEPVHLWKGSIVMADVAKFNGIATEISGDCSRLSSDVGEKVDVVGRIPFDTVWDYISRMKKMATKDILVIKIMPGSDEEKVSYTTLYNYLSKRSRIGVIGKTSEAVKDFYLYPLASHAPIPQVLLPLDGTGFDDERDNILLGIIVRSKQRSFQQRSSSVESSSHLPAKGVVVQKLSTVAEDEADKAPDRSYTPPLPDKELDDKLSKKDPRLKRKIRVHVDFNRTPLCNEEDDDSPYSPGDSDEDLPPLPKMSKTAVPGISPTVSKLLSPVSTAHEGSLQDPVEIQKKIDEMNRAIEEQTQQIQNLTSTVPKLAASVSLPTIPLLTSVTSAILTPAATPSVSLPCSLPTLSSTALSSKPTGSEVGEVELPLISGDGDERGESPPRSFTPPVKIEESIPFLPEVTSKISLPSNLQEILNSIQKKSEGAPSGQTPPSNPPSKAVEDVVKSKTPDISMALNVLNQTKNLLTSLTSISGKGHESGEKPEESSAILSRLSDEDIIRKAKEMEMEMEVQEEEMKKAAAAAAAAASQGQGQALLADVYQGTGACPPQPLPPGVQDIPMGSFGFTLPPHLFATPTMVPPPAADPSLAAQSVEEKSLTDTDERKQPKKFKLDPKSVFESEGVPDFMSVASTSAWEEKKLAKKSYKIDIKLGMNSLEPKNVDVDHFDIEGMSGAAADAGYGDDARKFPQAHKAIEESKYDVDERILPPKMDGKQHRGGGHDGRRRRSDDWEAKRDWKYDRRHWDDGRRYKDDYRRHGARRYGGPKFRKERFEDKRDRHLEKEWEGSIKDFEERQRRRNQEIRREELRRLRKRSDSSSN